MIKKLRHHPFAVDAYFRSSLVLTYAVPVPVALALVPQPLQPDTLHDDVAFLAVAIVDTRALRPAGFPRFTGRDFILTGYRVFVRYTTAAGKKLRGLYILRSETNKRLMRLLGNIFTGYQYQLVDMVFSHKDGEIKVHSAVAGLDIRVATGAGEATPLPAGSPFGSWAEARKFAGPMPFTFSVDAKRRETVLVEGRRSNWQPAPVLVEKADVGFLQQPLLAEAVLASAFLVQHVPYHWKKGTTDRW